MRTYRTNQHLERLASYLVASCKPFQFDGLNIEFTASDFFIIRLRCEDRVFKHVEFEIL